VTSHAKPDPAPPPDLRLELVSDPVYLCGVRELVVHTARRLGYTEKDASQIALAVDEALVNVIRHGYDRCCDGRIWLSISPQRSTGGEVEALHIIIEDEARQVDPCQIKGRSLDEIRPGGLGVHIIRQVMDEVCYSKREGCGMKLAMKKKRVVSGEPVPTGDCGPRHE
jgi:serine/threonine-protein kinase RsbW